VCAVCITSTPTRESDMLTNTCTANDRTQRTRAKQHVHITLARKAARTHHTRTHDTPVHHTHDSAKHAPCSDATAASATEAAAAAPAALDCVPPARLHAHLENTPRTVHAMLLQEDVDRRCLFTNHLSHTDTANTHSAWVGTFRESATSFHMMPSEGNSPEMRNIRPVFCITEASMLYRETSSTCHLQLLPFLSHCH